MTDQITVPRATLDAMREALESSAACIQFMTDGPRRADWGNTLDVIDAALTAANAVSEEALITVESSLRFRLECEQQKSADLLDEVRELKGKLFKARQPQAQGEAWVWNPASTEWEKVRAFGHWQQGAIYAFGSTQPEPLARPQATEPAQRCWCETCRPVTLGDMRMVVCPECGNKRCPKATHHDNACTNSNDIGQKGSSWEHVKPAAPEAKQ